LGTLSNDLLRRMNATANALRLVQINCSEEDGAAREQFLYRELKAALKDVPNSECRAFLAELSGHFPAWGDAAGGNAPVKPDALDLDSMLQRVIEQGVKLSSNQREEIIKRLREAWHLGSPAPILPPAKPLPAPVELPRVAVALQRFVEFVQAVDSASQRDGWKRLVDQSLKDERDSSLTTNLTEFRNRIEKAMAVTSVLPGVASKLCEQHLMKLRPENIETAVEAEAGGFFKNAKARCWEVYSQRLAPQLEEAPMQRAIRQAIDACIEERKSGESGR